MIKRLLTVVALAALAAVSQAAEVPAYSSPDQVMATLAARYPATRIDAVRESGLPGVYELAMGRKLVYVDASGTYFLFGHIFDLAANRDLTEERLQELARVDVSAIAADQLLDAGVAQGQGRRVVYVFSDPACIHCRQMEKTLAVLPDVDIHVVVLPLQEGSMAIARDIWCAADRQAAWSAWMLRGEQPKAAAPSCDAERVMRRNLDLANRFGIRGTPGLVSADGRVSMGAMNARDLAAWLAAGQTSNAISEVSQ
ncbi:DsbC family protein [Parasulfuritortus cantonensis]|uniref:Thiol:disulfide interchange protein n=1 Tax=Parasulfuritortus cantonensis TaxID=2528202 RepID=A0A4R1BQZ7_9PROT|nr:DsbC family protein [Parasulfuritortus cantonensis]TCJ20173.1 DsbC family protein [Parasulfuritortus cantonensis]